MSRDPLDELQTRLSAGEFEGYLRRELAALALVPTFTAGAWTRFWRRAQLLDALAWLTAAPPPRQTFALRGAVSAGLLITVAMTAVDLLFDGIPGPGERLHLLSLVLVRAGVTLSLAYMLGHYRWASWRRRTLASYAEALQALRPAPHGPAN